MSTRNKTKSFLISLKICYPGVELWVEDGKLTTNYQGADREAFLLGMTKLIEEHCR